MTKKELIKIIEEIPANCDIVLSSQPIITEYNGYSKGMIEITYNWDIQITSRKTISRHYKIKNGEKIFEKEKKYE